MTENFYEQTVDLLNSENFDNIVKKIKDGHISHDSGEKLLSEFIKTNIPNELKLKTYYFLTRITKSVETASSYIEAVEKLSINTIEEKVQLGNFYYGQGVFYSKESCSSSACNQALGLSSEFYKKSSLIAEEAKATDLLFNSIYGLAENSRKSGLLEHAQELMFRLQALASKSGNLMHVGWVDYLSGNICSQQSKNVEALSRFKAAESAFQKKSASYELQLAQKAIEACQKKLEKASSPGSHAG